ncbi:glucosamine--fructose-6-phosphate aminotransferase, isomerizing [Halobacteroides halobius DSM 5150]|uniref:Glutamine--fructose-6-phosphate aminotransferase [isomerizing] n=1 Tax=Halobacteroides halobius (strain ATCC 35273 / DSM 5150 / MD-1) TaxID=748449 RepID=L0K874_HALHC|nr:glutamine--fructose-6-phosphate transaminase (isomerizing) [Halobacteroides halobius]AGB40293.1 glucosamine--fructose-6-phosphate aminotransferase, isomerizing [Halobacteroides halobius DSM 5150]
MCGIVGYIGKQDATSILVDGLNRLEYRGYDSAGVALFKDNEIDVVKTVGKLADLEELVADEQPSGTIGIGHTRWATHGKPSTPNAHPHTSASGKFVVVHNGIIENYVELKEELQEKGYHFESETDTEVIPHLIEENYTGDLEETVRQVVAKLEGSYALAILSTEEPDKLIVVREDSPLIIGLGDDEYYIASDIPAILEYTDEVYILNDGEMGVITRETIDLSTVDGKPVEKEVFEVDWDPGMAEKAGYDHFMLKEIHEQPEALSQCLAGRLDTTDISLDDVNLTADELKQYDRIQVIACGTAYNSGLVGKYAIEKLARIPVEVYIGSEYRYRDPIIDDRTLVIVVSQSGETADTLAALREAQDKGAKVIAICNVVGSTIPREADEVLYLQAGPEIAVASTKAYITMLMAFYMLAIYFGRAKDLLADEDSRRLITALKALPKQTQQLIDENEDKIKALASEFANQENSFFIGRSIDNAVAIEGALKLKEISYIHAESYAAGELKHGTLALIEEGVPVVALATQESVLDKTLSNVKEVKARGGVVTGVTLAGEREIEDLDYRIEIPETEELLTSILAVVPLQLLAYYVAVERGCDVDQPRNLAKSVTVE